LATKRLSEPKITSKPVKDGITVFTDAGKQRRVAACTWKKDNNWEHHIIQGQPSDSLQIAEFAAVAWTLSNWLSEPLNVISDSLYVVGVVARIEDALRKPFMNQCLF
ncbi:POK18 protein, partial [Horornis vulcanius]|nr:POK18 protein [Horornis vulcanius]